MQTERQTVYGLVDPRYGEICFVGADRNETGVIDRLMESLPTDAELAVTPKTKWLSVLAERGLKPVLVILERGVPEIEVDDAQLWWIRSLRRAGNIVLVNPLAYEYATSELGPKALERGSSLHEMRLAAQGVEPERRGRRKAQG